MTSFAVSTLKNDPEDPGMNSINAFKDSVAESDRKLISKKRKKAAKQLGEEGQDLGEAFDANEGEGI